MFRCKNLSTFSVGFTTSLTFVPIWRATGSTELQLGYNLVVGTPMFNYLASDKDYYSKYYNARTDYDPSFQAIQSRIFLNIIVHGDSTVARLEWDDSICCFRLCIDVALRTYIAFFTFRGGWIGSCWFFWTYIRRNNWSYWFDYFIFCICIACDIKIVLVYAAWVLHDQIWKWSTFPALWLCKTIREGSSWVTF